MGNFWKKSIIRKEEVIENINQINKITNNSSFIIKTGLQLIFELDDKSLRKRKSHKIIKVKIFQFDRKYNQTILYKNKDKSYFRINIENFYKFFTIVMNSKMTRNIITSLITTYNENESDNQSNEEEDSGLCTICLENMIQIKLPCNHFFCEQCINKWIKDYNTCPLCRGNIDKINYYSEENKKKNEWVVFQNDEKYKEEADNENEQMFYNFIWELFYKKIKK